MILQGSTLRCKYHIRTEWLNQARTKWGQQGGGSSKRSRFGHSRTSLENWVMRAAWPFLHLDFCFVNELRHLAVAASTGLNRRTQVLPACGQRDSLPGGLSSGPHNVV